MKGESECVPVHLAMNIKYSNMLMTHDVIRDILIKYLDHFCPGASGTSAVAIDNKIEQAMDLVKSHLMFAVREEVEVLKEKIAELMDKINQLEVENTILKAHASQETLSQLTTQVSQKAPQPPSNNAA